MVDDALGTVIEANLQLSADGLRGLYRAPTSHFDGLKARLQPAGTCWPDGALAQIVLRIARQHAQQCRRGDQIADARGSHVRPGVRQLGDGPEAFDLFSPAQIFWGST